MLRVDSSGDTLTVCLDGRPVIRHSPDRPFADAGRGRWSVAGTAVTDTLLERAPLAHAQYEAGRSLLRLHGGHCSLSFHMAERDGNLVLTPQRSSTGLNRLWLRFPALPDSPVYGGGARYDRLNLRGRKHSLWVAETRLFRRHAPPQAVHMRGTGAAPTACPIPVFFTDSGLFYSFDCPARMAFDFTAPRHHLVQFWDLPASVTAGSGATPLETVSRLTRLTGRQPILPQWFLEGACLESRGGSAALAELLEKTLGAGAAVSGVYLPDWSGGFETPGGHRPFHDWIWNRDLYPRLDAIIRELSGRGIRAMAYISPHLSIEGRLFAEASAAGYLIKKPQGGAFISDMGGFMAGHLDLTNATACGWFKNTVQKNVLDLGFCGFLADRGDYLPPDALLHSGEDPLRIHNQWPLLWARLTRDIVREAGRTADSVIFTRTGWAGVGGQSMLLSTGDHHTNWNLRTGLPSALTASLSLACSGVGLSLADCGGNVSFLWGRSKELCLRWMELAAFSPVLRLAGGDGKGWRFDSDRETLSFFVRMSRVHAALGVYLRACVRENASDGWPVIRPLFLQFPDQPDLARRQDAYMLGGEMIVFPLTTKSRSSIRVRLPPGNWVHLWSGRQYGPGEHTLFAPLGKPAVFYRPDGKHASHFEAITAGAGGWGD